MEKYSVDVTISKELSAAVWGNIVLLSAENQSHKLQ